MVGLATALCSLFCLLFVVVFPGLFAGKPQQVFKFLSAGIYVYICVVLINLIRVTLAFWDALLEDSFMIVEIAELYDEDPEDDDNLRETVVSVVGRSRGIIWTAIPGGLVISKLCEALNDATPFDVAPKLEMATPRVTRFIKWVFAIATFVFNLLIIFWPTP